MLQQIIKGLQRVLRHDDKYLHDQQNERNVIAAIEDLEAQKREMWSTLATLAILDTSARVRVRKPRIEN